MRIATGSHIKQVNNLQVEEAHNHNVNCTHMIYLLSRCYLWDVSFHVLIIPQIVNKRHADFNVWDGEGERKEIEKNSNERHDDDETETDQNVLECRYNNLTSCVFLFIVHIKQKEDVRLQTTSSYIWFFYVYKLRVTYPICFKCQCYQLQMIFASSYKYYKWNYAQLRKKGK